MAHFFLSSAFIGVHTVIYRHSIVDGHTHWVSRHAGMQVGICMYVCNYYYYFFFWYSPAKSRKFDRNSSFFINKNFQ